MQKTPSKVTFLPHIFLFKHGAILGIIRYPCYIFVDAAQVSRTFFQLNAQSAYRAVCLQVPVLEVRPEVTISGKAS